MSNVLVTIPIKLKKYTLWLWGILLGVSLSVLAPNQALSQTPDHIILFEYEVQDYEFVSTLYYSLGIGCSRCTNKLYGKQGWLKAVRRLNPKLGNLNRVRAGRKLILPLPANLKQNLKKLKGGYKLVKDEALRSKALPVLPPPPDPEIALREKAAAEEAERRRKTEEERQKQIAVVAQAPEKHDIQEIAKLPEETIKEIPKEVIKEKLTDETVAQLDEKTIEKIPDEVKEEKAWEASAFDAFKPGMNKLFDGVTSTTAAGYIGLRYGISLLDKEADPLLAQIHVIGAIAEFRGTWLKGLRLLFEEAPTVNATMESQSVNLGWQKTLLGWAIEFEAPFLFDVVHITPRYGLYSITATLPIGRDEDNALITYDTSVDRAQTLGLEADVEIAKFFYILRLWAGEDFDLSNFGFAKGSSSAISQRYGLDLFIKGSGYKLGDQNLSLSYLAFYANESLELTRYNDGEQLFKLNLAIPYAGLGLSLSW